MPCQRVKFGGRVAFITYQLDWKPGDLPPTDKSDYLGWHEWAEVQHQAGLRQQQCGGCGKWFYPQELSSTVRHWTAFTYKKMTKRVKLTSPLCKICEPKP